MWISGFNGGNAQLFHIETRTTGNEWSPYKLDIEDEGQGKLMAHTLGNLTSSTDYTIRLNVSNKIGLGNSSVIEVRTLEKPSPISAGSDSTVIVVVVVLTLILVATAGIVLVMMRRRNQGGTAKNNVVTANNEYAVASGGDAARKNVVPADNENNEYAVVFKPPKGAAKNTALNTDTENEYAVVTKPSKGQKQNHKHGGSVPRSQPGPSLQEPQPGPSSQEPQPGPSRTVNQDGLIYLDVEFKPQPGGGGRGVIHGADDRTEYTFVDFSKTAPNSS
ncbi:uncharacterized protein LOC110451051 [Mizuhopecten yessoensis]|uniref:uncharacterized protein LOC110451051 n=1 Tax=Mizuhopecten yessoensis TaxID=6573 RepID=UPI000B458E99|nr:uncharacterized protein LOC110451051 [Mizuhopecten yessoensis]